jgi:hypothetical protein
VKTAYDHVDRTVVGRLGVGEDVADPCVRTAMQ